MKKATKGRKTKRPGSSRKHRHTRRRHGGMNVLKKVGSKTVDILQEVAKDQVQKKIVGKDWFTKSAKLDEMKKKSHKSCERWKDIYESEDKENMCAHTNENTKPNKNSYNSMYDEI
jgi:hypothetical protein